MKSSTGLQAQLDKNVDFEAFFEENRVRQLTDDPLKNRFPESLDENVGTGETKPLPDDNVRTLNLTIFLCSSLHFSPLPKRIFAGRIYTGSAEYR